MVLMASLDQIDDSVFSNIRVIELADKKDSSA
jgi:hypothetical protein